MAPDRALRALTQQLEGLQNLKNRNYEEADGDETEWMHLTQNIIEEAFGDPSSNLDKFLAASHATAARWASDAERWQKNFELRIKEFEALLRALISTLRLRLPEEEVKGRTTPAMNTPSTAI